MDCCVGVTFDAEANKMFHISDEKLYLKKLRTCPGKHFKTPKWDYCIKQLKKFSSKVLFFFLRWTARKNDSQKMRVKVTRFFTIANIPDNNICFQKYAKTFFFHGTYIITTQFKYLILLILFKLSF